MPFFLTSKCSHINPLNAELNPICHLLALLEGATIVVVSRLRVKDITERSEDIKRTMMASKTTEDAMVLKEMMGKLLIC